MTRALVAVEIGLVRQEMSDRIKVNWLTERGYKTVSVIKELEKALKSEVI